MRTKLLLELCFLGTDYCGWQAQPGEDVPSVHAMVHAALRAVGIDGGPVAAGRLDCGVHAKQQLVHVNLRRPPAFPGPERDRELHDLTQQLNAALPADIRVLRVRDIELKAHALHSSGAKTYCYYILNDARIAEGCEAYCWAIEPPLDTEAMARAAAMLEGTHDFRHLSSAPPHQDAVRTLQRVEVRRTRHVPLPLVGCLAAPAADVPVGVAASGTCTMCSAGCDHEGVGPLIEMQFTAKGFLRHQVRRMVSILVQIGTGEVSEADLALALESSVQSAQQLTDAHWHRQHEQGDKHKPPRAPAAGLWLHSVEYGHLLGDDNVSSLGPRDPERFPEQSFGGTSTA